MDIHEICRRLKLGVGTKQIADSLHRLKRFSICSNSVPVNTLNEEASEEARCQISTKMY